jgi:hypothetical protein
MSDDLLPGFFLDFADADSVAVALHLAGADSASVREDSPDVFGNDPVITSTDGPSQWNREQLPQFGPSFVSYTHERFDRIEKLIEKHLARWSYEPVTVVLVASMQTDGSGNVGRGVQANSILYEPPPGFTLALHRFSILNGGNNFGTPFNAAAGYWELRVNDEMIDGASLEAPAAGKVGGTLPVVKTWGTRDAPRIRDGEVMSLFMSGGPVSQKLTVKGQGTLERQPES